MSRLAVACDDGVVRFFTVEEGVPGAQYQASCAAVEGRLLCLAWHPAASTLFSGHSDATIRAWDAASGRELYRINAGASGGRALLPWACACTRSRLHAAVPAPGPAIHAASPPWQQDAF